MQSNINQPSTGKFSMKLFQRVKLKSTLRQRAIIFSVFGVLMTAGFFIYFNISINKEAKAASETLKSGAFIVNMGITPQTYANGMKPYGMVYDLIINYSVPVKWIINPAKVKDGPDFNYNATNYRGGTFIIEAEYIDSSVATRIAYWQGQGVQGAYTTADITVPVYTTLTSFPNILIDTLSSNQAIAAAYFTNAEIPSSAYSIGRPGSLNQCHDLWINPHGDPVWADYSYLYNFVIVQKSYIWVQCHAVSMMEGCFNPSIPAQQLNYLTSNGLQCWKSTGGVCGPLITETHAKPSTAPYTYYYPTDPVMQFMGSMSGPTTGGSEQWYIPLSTGGWRANTKRLVTTATGISPNEGVLMTYGPAYGNAENGLVMYTSGHDLNAGGSNATHYIAAQRSFLNYSLIAGKAKAPVFSASTIPVVFTGAQSQWISVTVTGGTPSYTYQWTSSLAGGYFSDPNAAGTYYEPPNVSVPTQGVLRCIVTDACNRRTFITQIFNITPSPLPVKLINFTAKASADNSVVVKWTTAAEINNDYFTIERSQDGKSFAALTQVDGSGSGTNIHNYEFTDDNPLMGTSYYRLRQTDYNGKDEVFRAVSVSIGSKQNVSPQLKIAPNPFTESFTAQFICEDNQDVQVQLLTMSGAVLFNDQITAGKGNNTYLFSQALNLKAGNYFFRISNGKTILANTIVCKK